MKKISAIVLALVLAFVMALPAFAAQSFVADERATLTTKVEGNGKAEKVKSDDGSYYTVTAISNEGEDFKEWKISGTEGVDYKLIEGSKTSKVIKISIANDVEIVAVFTANNGTAGGSDSGETSPESGYNTAVLAIVALVSLAGFCFAAKKSVKA